MIKSILSESTRSESIFSEAFAANNTKYIEKVKSKRSYFKFSIY